MRINAVNDEMLNKYKKHKLYFITTGMITLFCIGIFICLLLFFIEKLSFILIIVIGLIIEISFPASTVFLISILKLKYAIKEIGKDLVVCINDNRITLADKHDNKTIFIEHNINKIKIMPHSFDMNGYFLLNAIKSNFGLLIIIDEEKFFKAMSAKYHKRLSPYEQRVAILEGGFFIACSSEESLVIIDKIQKNSNGI